MNDIDIRKQRVEALKGKKVLFFSPAFFGYEYKVVKKLQDMGIVCDFYNERSVSSAISRALLKISPKIFYQRTNEYYSNILSKNVNKDYDYVLVIKGEMIPTHILQRIKDTYPRAKMCLYLWDSISNIPGILKKISWFDSTYSFDSIDCQNYKVVKFRPLFYADEFKESKIQFDKKFDICFIGTIHSDRYQVIKQVKKVAELNNLKCYWFCYLQSWFMYYFYKFTKKEFWNTSIDDFSFDKKNSSEIAEIIRNSKVVLDVEHPKQTGLTMRTIEILGMSKKLITTNGMIKEYDFYNSNNICIIDRHNVKIDKNFINTPYKKIDESIYDKYSLESWVLDILN